MTPFQSQLLSELKAMRAELSEIRRAVQRQNSPLVNTKEAMAMIGITNPRLLTHFHDDLLLKRVKGGVSYLYDRKDCEALAEKIRDGVVKIPSIVAIYKKEAA